MQTGSATVTPGYTLPEWSLVTSSYYTVREIMSEKRVRDIMHKGVIACHPNTAVAEVVRVLADTEVHGVVVTGAAGELAGIISHMDVIPLYNKELEGKTAADIMTKDVITVSLDASVQEAMQLMVTRHIHRLVVSDRNEKGLLVPVGVLSTTDIVRDMRGSRWMWYFSPNP